MNNISLDLLKKQFNNRVDFREKRPGILQLIAPFYHEDGDMLDIFLQVSPDDAGKIRLSDFGMTLMRLSYTYDIDTPNKEKIFSKIIAENNLSEQNGSIFIDVDATHLFSGVFQFTQTIAKLSNMRLFGREVVKSLFYEMLAEFITSDLKDYNPISKVYPIPERDDLEVDFELNSGKKPIYLFGVKDAAKSRLTTISCLEFQRANLKFKSVVVHENFESLPRKDQTRLTSACDKQFIDLPDFKKNAIQFIEREIA